MKLKRSLCLKPKNRQDYVIIPRSVRPLSANNYVSVIASPSFCRQLSYDVDVSYLRDKSGLNADSFSRAPNIVPNDLLEPSRKCFSGHAIWKCLLETKWFYVDNQCRVWYLFRWRNLLWILVTNVGNQYMYNFLVIEQTFQLNMWDEDSVTYEYFLTTNRLRIYPALVNHCISYPRIFAKKEK